MAKTLQLEPAVPPAQGDAATPKPPSPKNKPPPAPAAEPRGERLQKLLAGAGLGSRREIEGWIEAGRVSVAGRSPGSATARFHMSHPGGWKTRSVRGAGARVLLYHKPVGELVTRSDPQGRPTVFSRLPQGRWVAVGRLDINSSGLLLLTDSGELANRLMHPRYERRARIRGAHPRRALAGRAKDSCSGRRRSTAEPARFERVRSDRESEGRNHWYRVVLKEGRNREVRRLFEALGHAVSRLRDCATDRSSCPPILRQGSWRELRNPVILQKL